MAKDWADARARFFAENGIRRRFRICTGSARAHRPQRPRELSTMSIAVNYIRGPLVDAT